MTDRRLADGFTTVLFDFDGTLADTLPLIYMAFGAGLEPVLGRTPDPAEIRGWFGPPDTTILRSLVSESEAWAAIERYIDVYERYHADQVELYPGIADLLDAAQSHAIRMAVVTGKSRVTALYSLQQLGIHDYFELVYAGDDVERQKPDPQAILAALVDMGVTDRASVAMVGDSEADVLAGHAAGITSIGVMWGNPDHDELRSAAPDVLCDNVGALRTALGI
ncbi:HAD family hydrolase [soil metagenome]